MTLKECIEESAHGTSNFVPSALTVDRVDAIKGHDHDQIFPPLKRLREFLGASKMASSSTSFSLPRALSPHCLRDDFIYSESTPPPLILPHPPPPTHCFIHGSRWVGVEGGRE
jgi:hypothetical protein